MHERESGLYRPLSSFRFHPLSFAGSFWRRPTEHHPFWHVGKRPIVLHSDEKMPPFSVALFFDLRYIFLKIYSVKNRELERK